MPGLYQYFPRLARAARDAIRDSTDRTASVAADAHVLLYFLHSNGDDEAQFHHIAEATRLRPHHSRQWMLRATTYIPRGDWHVALKFTRKSRDLATTDYERWSMDMSVGKCLMNVMDQRHEARGILDSAVALAFNEENKLGLTMRGYKDAVWAHSFS